MTDKQSVFCVHYVSARAFLFLRGFYLLLTADLWLEMVEHGGRYGVGDFNVAHFGWIDALVPLPTPTLYVGLLITSGLISFQLAVGHSPRWLRLALATLYTFAWLISMHDSYQHHYLISWLLIWCAGYPDLTPTDEALRESRLVRGWGFPMTAITCAIVYTFTGISKSERIWHNGHVLRVLTHSRPPGDPRPGKFDGLRDVLLHTGLDDRQIWQLLALATIALQWTIALGYLAAAARDQRPSTLRTVLTSCGLAGSFAFHTVAELFRVFEIGLFSYYMLWIATVVLSPRSVVSELARLVPFCSGALQSLTKGLAAALRRHARSHRALSLGSVLALAAIGWIIPLPGARVACAASAAIALIRLFTEVGPRGDGPSWLPFALRNLATALVAAAALSLSRVPFDYYRRTAGELRRMGQLEQALDLYRHAERYAPSGSSRIRTIRELEAELIQKTADHPAP